MDKIVALYKSHAVAEQTRLELFRQGFATDRVDVVASSDHGRAINRPECSTEEDLRAHFSAFLHEPGDETVVRHIVDAIGEGKGVLVVHPRGKIEIEQARDIIDSREPETILWRVAPPESQGGLLGEHAAGFKR